MQSSLYLTRRLSSAKALDRFNTLGIQMLPLNIQEKIFPNSDNCPPTLQQIQSSTNLLKSFNLYGKTQVPLECMDIELPELVGDSLAEHFYLLGLEQSEPYLSIAKNFCKAQLPKRPLKWSSNVGWTRYTATEVPQKVDHPLEDAVVFDIETLMSEGQFPVIATAVSKEAWYSWTSPQLFSDKNFSSFIPMATHSAQKLVVGHHVSFDRSRILEEYQLKASKTMFIDTMSLHCAVGGLSSQQRPSWATYKKSKREASQPTFDSVVEKEFYEAKLKDHEKPWHKVSSLNSLQDVANLHTGADISKDQRKVFEKGSRTDVLDNYQELMDYCATDVAVTFKVFQQLLPRFLEKCPHPVSFAGLVHMSRPFLTVNSDWKEFIANADRQMHENQANIESSLLGAAEDAIDMMKDEKWRSDPWLSVLDWSLKTEKVPKTSKDPLKLEKRIRKYNALMGRPQWYRDLWDSQEEKIKITTTKRIAPYLLKLQWNNNPVYHSRRYGWTFRVPRQQCCNQGEALQFSESINDQNYDPVASLDKNNYYFKIPHKDGPDQNCGNPLGKNYIKEFESMVLKSEYSAASDIIQRTVLCNYWVGSRQRIIDQFVVWQRDCNQMGNLKGFESKELGLILPQVVSMGTITRRSVESTWMAAANAKSNRIGSEVKAMIKPPQGYSFVGADVDSQELWIASLLGDAQFGLHGASPFGFMTLQGSKTNSTDLHSRTAELLGISRDSAKVFNYARIYGAGVRYASQLLKQCSPDMEPALLERKAVNLYAETKGQRARLPYTKEPFWHGGSESFMFNVLEKIIKQTTPRTPTLGCIIPDGLIPSNVRDDASLYFCIYY